MTKSEVMALLKENQNPRGMDYWIRHPKKLGKLKSHGIGLTQLRKMAKEIGRDHKLARQLWKSNVYDAKVLGLLIDDPKKMTREQAEEQVEQLNEGMLTHVFASCGATLAKTPFAVELVNDWMNSSDPVRRRCGFSLLYELSKRKIKSMDDAYFMDRISYINETIHDQDMWVREAMCGALLGIGKRNKMLNQVTINAVKSIGPVDIDYGPDNGCEPIDLMKHLTSDYLQKKFARTG